MMQNSCKTLSFKKKNGLQNSPWGGGKPYPASGLVQVILLNLMVAMVTKLSIKIDLK